MSGSEPSASPNRGWFISFEGTEGGGKSTQIALLAERCLSVGLRVRSLREPGGTPVGEEIRHTLKHSPSNHALTSEAELLLMNASRAQLVREVIRPALAAGEGVLCDRFADSTVAYQGFGRQMDLTQVRAVIDLAVGHTWPDITFLLSVPIEVSERRRAERAGSAPVQRDRFEELDQAFFRRVEAGFAELARQHPKRILVIDATRSIAEIHDQIWKELSSRLRAGFGWPDPGA